MHAKQRRELTPWLISLAGWGFLLFAPADGQGRSMVDWFKNVPPRYFENARCSSVHLAFERKERFIVDEIRGTLVFQGDTKRRIPTINFLKLKSKSDEKLFFVLLFKYPNATYLNILEHRNGQFVDVTIGFLGEPVYCPSTFSPNCRMATLDEKEKTIIVSNKDGVLIAKYVWDGNRFRKHAYLPQGK